MDTHSDIKFDLRIQARENVTVCVIRIVWQLHSAMVAGWASFHHKKLPETLDLTNLDAQAVRVFDDWCLHRPSWKDGVTARLFGPCMELHEYIAATDEFVNDLAQHAVANIRLFDENWNMARKTWNWRDVVPFLKLVPTIAYAKIMDALLARYQHGKDGWWDHGFSYCDQRMLAHMCDWLTRQPNDKDNMTFRLFLRHTDHPLIATFLESEHVRYRLMLFVISNAEPARRDIIAAFCREHPAWVPMALRAAHNVVGTACLITELKNIVA
jgi:hypothetical protein